MLRMKKVLVALLATASVAALLMIQLRQPSQEKTKSVSPPKMTSRAGVDQSSRLLPIPGDNAGSATTNIPQPSSPGPLSGNMVTVHGLPPVFLGSGDAPWESTIEEIANRADVPDRIKARLLIQMLPGLPDEAVAKAAEEAAIRLSNADYKAVLLPTLLDPHTHGMAMSVLFADLMKRPETISIPILQSIAQDPSHPYSPFASDNLRLMLGRTQ